MSPPLPAGPRLPDKDPSELSLNQPTSGFSHLVLLTTCSRIILGSFTQCSYSIASRKISWPKFCWMVLLWKTMLFLCFQMHQIVNRKEVFQGGWSMCFFVSAFLLMVIHWCRLPLKKDELTSLAPSWVQKFLTLFQSLSAWIIDLESERHNGQVGSTGTPLLARHSLTPILLCKHIHTNVCIRGRMLTFHTHWPEKGPTSLPIAIWYALLSSNLPWMDLP